MLGTLFGIAAFSIGAALVSSLSGEDQKNKKETKPENTGSQNHKQLTQGNQVSTITDPYVQHLLESSRKSASPSLPMTCCSSRNELIPSWKPIEEASLPTLHSDLFQSLQKSLNSEIIVNNQRLTLQYKPINIHIEIKNLNVHL